MALLFLQTFVLEVAALVDDLADGVALMHPREDVDLVALDAL